MSLPLSAVGLQAPLRHWYHDTHWRLACWAALPVWFGLGWWLTPYLRAPTQASAWLSLVLVQPLIEEITLRGVVQSALSAWTTKRLHAGRFDVSVANGLTTVCFVALHLSHQPWPWAVAVAGPSLLLGHLRERLGSVWPGVLLHAGYNLGFGCVATWTRVSIAA